MAAAASRQPLSIRDKIRNKILITGRFFSFGSIAGYRAAGSSLTAGSGWPAFTYQLVTFAWPGLAPGSFYL